MKKVTCIAVDDEPLFLKELEAFTYGISWLNLIGGYSNPIKAATAIIRDNPDLLLLDVEMPQIDGYNFIEWLSPRLAEMPDTPKIVLVTALDHNMGPYEEIISAHILKNEVKTPEDLDRLLRNAIH